AGGGGGAARRLARRGAYLVGGSDFGPLNYLWGLRPHAPFRFACASEWHRWAQIRPSPGGWGRNIFVPNKYYSIRWLLGLPGPGPGYFLLVQKVTKNTH